MTERSPFDRKSERTSFYFRRSTIFPSRPVFIETPSGQLLSKLLSLSLEDARNILFSSSFRIPVRLQPPFPAPPWSWERWYIDLRTALLARFCDIIEICFAEITRDFYDSAHSLSSTPIICIFNPPRKYVCGLSSRGIIKIYSRRTINCTRSE